MFGLSGNACGHRWMGVREGAKEKTNKGGGGPLVCVIGRGEGGARG